MKKITVWLVLLLSSILLLPALVSAAEAPIQLFMNGKPLVGEVPPRIVNGNTLVPIRIIAESLGSEVSWEPKERKVTIDKGKTSIQLFIDKTKALVGSQSFELETAPTIAEGNTLLPVRFVSEQLGVDVKWDEITRSVFLYQNEDKNIGDGSETVDSPQSEEPIKAGDEAPAGGDEAPQKNTEVPETIAGCPAPQVPADKKAETVDEHQPTDAAEANAANGRAAADKQQPSEGKSDDADKSGSASGTSEDRADAASDEKKEAPGTNKTGSEGLVKTSSLAQNSSTDKLQPSQSSAADKRQDDKASANGKESEAANAASKGTGKSAGQTSGTEIAGDKQDSREETANTLNGEAASASQTDKAAALPVFKGVKVAGDCLVIMTDGGEPEPKVFSLSGPDRIVIDLPQAVLDPELDARVNPQGEGQLAENSDYVASIRYSLFSKEPSTVRIVIDLSKKTKFTRVQESVPNQLTFVFGGRSFPAKSGKPRIVLDAGHGGKDPGTTSASGRHEKDFVLPLTLKVNELLKQEPGIEVILTRSDDTYPELSERVEIANLAQADLFVSIHGNSVLENPSIRGTETYYWTDQSREFAEIMHRHLLVATEFPDRKVKKNNFYVIRNTEMPSVLLEIGFLSNTTEEAMMYSEAFQDKVAASIAAAIKEQLNLD